MANSKHTMDSIQLPDQDKLNNLKDGFSDQRKVHKETGFDDFTNVTRADFSRATAVNIPTRTEEKEDDEDDFIPKTDPNRKANNIGVRVGKRYVAKTRLLKIIIVCIIIFAVILFFFPPIVTNNYNASKCENINVFQNIGISELKEEIYKNKNVYNEDALSSEKSENYRLCTIVLSVKNYTPFELKISGYEIVTADTMYKDRFVYASSSNENGDIIPAFSTQPVKVEVLVNVAELTDEQFDTAVTSLVLKTVGMKKKVSKSSYCPCLPAFVFVSDAISFELEQ